MNALTAIIKILDRFTEVIGKTAAYFSVLMVLVTCYIVVTRYIFNIGAIAIQESVIYLNAILFLATAAFTLKHNGHVRVDIFYNSATIRHKAWVNFLGSIFLLLPVSIFILWISWDYVMASWSVLEESGEAGGLPFVYLLKSLILVMGFTVIAQGIAEILRNAEQLFFAKPDPTILSDEHEGSAL
jgi:TRAP-type mannitol/chloroaromatic compound transport system permease small subunit